MMKLISATISSFLVLVLTVGECIVLPLSCNYMAKTDCKLFVWNKRLFNAAMHVVFRLIYI